ncbi:hypothetical protein [Photobacterium indicum]|uniref:hypothetical protein n=1 Tax=Photobacterium indicum TaxID=81447 RepID=UPI003D09F0F8
MRQVFSEHELTVLFSLYSYREFSERTRKAVGLRVINGWTYDFIELDTGVAAKTTREAIKRLSQAYEIINQGFN